MNLENLMEELKKVDTVKLILTGVGESVYSR